MPTAINERPILFSAPMVRAILEGRKTQTRRVVKCDYTNPEAYLLGVHKGVWGIHKDVDFDSDIWRGTCPYGVTGDRLWVRESFWQASYYPSTMPCGEPSPQRDNWGSLVKYAADGDPENTPNRHYPDGLQNGAISAPNPYAAWHKRPSIHMPRKRSRITLEITGVRIERLNDISEADAYAEGVTIPTHMAFASNGSPELRNEARVMFEQLWESINGPGSWATNPFVWVIEFKRLSLSQTVDQKVDCGTNGATE
jgi:hypothetical protein